MKKKTLLEQASAIPVREKGRPRTTKPDPDVAIAWLKGELRQVQISRALYPDRSSTNTTTQVYTFLNQSIREACRLGKIKIVG